MYTNTSGVVLAIVLIALYLQGVVRNEVKYRIEKRRAHAYMVECVKDYSYSSRITLEKQGFKF